MLLVRHGESKPAVAGQPFALKDGHGDPELHPDGHEQARLLGARLRAYPISAVYVSSLQRTAQTAAPLCEHLGLQPRVDADLREVYLGEWEGGLLRIKEQEQDPLILKMHTEQRWDVIPNAESNARLRQRLMRALKRIRLGHPNELVVAVVHGGVIGQIIAAATGAENFAFIGAANGSISKLVLAEERIIVRGFNDTSHLKGG